MVSARALHHIRLFYAAYFAAMGLILPFFPVYLDERGLGVTMIGVMTGLLAAAKVIAPPCIGRLLDRRPQRWVRRFIVTASLLAAISTLGIGFAHQLLMLAAWVLIFGVFWAAILPLTDGLSVSVSEAALADYGRLRVWGSIGFILASLGGGYFLSGPAIQSLPLALFLLMLTTALAASGFPDVRATQHAAAAPFGAAFYRLLGVSLIMQASHGAYYGFFSLYLAQAGFSSAWIGMYWVLGVLAEIVLMWRWSRPLQQLDPARLFATCLLLAALRWLGTGLTTNPVLIAMLQCLHAASFAAFHVAAIAWVKRFAPDQRQASAQGWYSAAGFGLGGALGIMGCGVIVDAWGYAAAFYACAMLACLGIPLARALSAAGFRAVLKPDR